MSWSGEDPLNNAMGKVASRNPPSASAIKNFVKICSSNLFLSSFGSCNLNSFPFLENLISAFFVGITDTYRYTLLIISSIGKMISGSISADNLGGPIQISVLAGSAAKAGYVTFLSMIALLSINLGLLNLLPIPILDGGQLLMIAIEKLKGSPVSEAILEYSTRVGIVLIVSLMVFAFANDIARFI